MKKLRVEQRKGEAADIFAMRAFALALPHMDLKATSAFAKWIYQRADADIRQRSMESKIDGLTCVEWVKKRRNELSGCTLQEAKREWDRRVEAAL